MTETLFTTDSYCREFQAAVLKLDTDKKTVTLDKTAFYPGGGGQPYDTGWLEYSGQRIEVVKTRKLDNHILHYLEGDLPETGAQVTGVVDWNRRYSVMRTHTALHIMCGVIFRDYKAQVTGGNMEPLKGRLDFEFESWSAELVREIEKRINIEVDQGRKINIKILPREEAFKIPDLIRTKINLLPESLKEIRVVDIDGLDLQADGGTHVANTKEVGIIRITKHKSKGRINKRLEIGLDEILNSTSSS